MLAGLVIVPVMVVEVPLFPMKVPKVSELSVAVPMFRMTPVPAYLGCRP